MCDFFFFPFPKTKTKKKKNKKDIRWVGVQNLANVGDIDLEADNYDNDDITEEPSSVIKEDHPLEETDDDDVQLQVWTTQMLAMPLRIL